MSINVSGQKTASASAAPTPNTVNVKVVNTAAETVPVTGSVTIGNTPAVDARQSGDWNVGITGTPIVNIGNTSANPALVRDVSNAREPFMRSVDLGIIPDNTGAGAQFPACPNNPNLCSNAVPPGKLMVVEYISAWAYMEPGQRISANVETVGVPLRFYPVIMFYQASTQAYGDILAGSNETKLYFWPGETVGARVRRDSPSGNALVSMTISGYFINIP
jgi:hypothetical protein